MNYYNYAKKLLFISDKKLTEILPLISLFVFASLIEFIGLGLIIPYVTIIINPDNFENIKYLSYFNLEEKDFNYFLFFLSIALIVIFFLKFINLIPSKSISKIFVNLINDLVIK